MKEFVRKLHSRLFIWAECVTGSGFLIKPTQMFQTHAPLSSNQESFFLQRRFCGNVMSAACITLQNVLLLHHTAETQPGKMRLRTSAEPPCSSWKLQQEGSVKQQPAGAEDSHCSYKCSICGLDLFAKQQRVCRAHQRWPGTSVLLWCSLALLCCGFFWLLLLLFLLCSSTSIPLLPSSVPPEKNQL